MSVAATAAEPQNARRIVIVKGNAVKPATTPLPEVAYQERILQALGDKTESFARDTRPLLSQRGNLNPFFEGAIQAFSHHHALVLSPDMIWLLIAQAFALHINANPEALRSRFVSHEGKEVIEVFRNSFTKGFAGNDWEGVFGEFSERIKEYIGDEKHALLVQSFSTTGIVEKAAFEVTLMDAMQEFFEYAVTTECGIPEFHLEGEVEDWYKLREAAGRLVGYGLGWWTPHLNDLLAEFEAASAGRPNPTFWEDFFNLGGASGGPFLCGRINTLFPYILDHGKKPFPNDYADPNYAGGWGGGITTNLVPSGLSIAPFIWNYYGTKYPMEFVAGFVGVEQAEDTLALRPKIGWGVRDK
jgi:hypothetical protein